MRMGFSGNQKCQDLYSPQPARLRQCKYRSLLHLNICTCWHTIFLEVHVNFCPWSHDWRSLQWMEMDLHVSSRLKISAPRICFKATEAEALLYNDARQHYGSGVPNQVS